MRNTAYTDSIESECGTYLYVNSYRIFSLFFCIIMYVFFINGNRHQFFKCTYLSYRWIIMKIIYIYIYTHVIFKMSVRQLYGYNIFHKIRFETEKKTFELFATVCSGTTLYNKFTVYYVYVLRLFRIWKFCRWRARVRRRYRYDDIQVVYTYIIIMFQWLVNLIFFL